MGDAQGGEATSRLAEDPAHFADVAHLIVVHVSIDERDLKERIEEGLANGRGEVLGSDEDLVFAHGFESGFTFNIVEAHACHGVVEESPLFVAEIVVSEHQRSEDPTADDSFVVFERNINIDIEVIIHLEARVVA